MRGLPARLPMTRGAVLLVLVLGLPACRQTPAPDNAPPPPVAAPGKFGPVAPNPPAQTAAPAPSPASPPAPAATPPPAASAPAPTAAATTPAKPVPRKPAAPKPPATAAAPASASKPAPAADTSAPAATPAPAASPAPPPAAKPAAPAAPALDLGSLEQRLRDTKAIGVFTKLSLKNQVDDLLGDVRAFHGTPPKGTQSVLRQEFEGLMMKVLASLQGGDPQLANTISASREALWGILIDPVKFSKI